MKAIPKTLLLLLVLLFPVLSFAHCDSVAGPVAKDVEKALTSGDLSPVLKWIRPSDESELRSAFQRAMTVRNGGKDAAALADQFFLETAVRLHRASEGEPYTGLKPASAAEEPAPAMIDGALKTNSFSQVEDSVIADLRTQLHAKISRLQQVGNRAGDSVAHGREYVRTYVELIHYIERLQKAENPIDPEGHGHE
jgi:hypothetical protein